MQPPDSPPTRIAILFGTETGNAQECAEDLATAIRNKGLECDCIDMGQFEPSGLAKEALVFIVTSTYGNGDPPANAEAMHAWLQTDEPQLSGLRFGVCSLGDRTYPLFAQCGKDFDRLLEERGATRVITRIDCDSGLDYYEPYEGFQAKCLEYLDSAGTEPAAAVESAPAAPISNSANTNRPTVYKTALHERVRLTRTECADATWHLAFRFEGETPTFEPGDSLAVTPHNDPTEADRIAEWLGTPDATVQHGGEGMPMSAALGHALCLQSVTGELAKTLESHSDTARQLAHSAEQLGAYRDQHDVFDLLTTAPASSISAQDLVDAMRPQMPRQYSVASSRNLHPGEVHFTISTFDRDRPGRTLRGTASSWLCERLEMGAPVPMTMRANPRFRATTDTPMIMIGPGTGVAPFRGFLQDLEAAKRIQHTWLFFGHRRRAEDFLYEDELVDYQKSGRLSRLNLAWSRDQADKHYVQHEMLTQADELWKWLGEGAHIYVCGDAQAMAPDVRRALQEIATSKGGVRDGQEWLAQLKSDGRFCEDVY